MALAGLVPVVCVGEDRHLSPDETAAHIHRQTLAALHPVPTGSPAVVLYEPAWAIGAGQGADPGHAATVLDTLHRAASAHPGTRMIYGGAVTPGTYSSLRRLAPWDGVALGRAAQDARMLDDVLCELLPPAAAAHSDADADSSD